MNTKTKIISFILTLALMFGCVSTTLFAVSAGATELQGGVITEEDIEQGATDALTSSIPAANGILSAEELKALGVNVVGTFDCNSLSQNYFNGAHVSQGFGYNTVITDEESGRKYLRFHEATDPFICGKTSETYIHFNISNANNYANVVKNYELVRGASTVLSFDIRLAETFNAPVSLLVLRSYNNVAKNEDGTATIVNLDLSPVYLNTDGSVNIASGFTADGKTYTLRDKISKGASDATDFANFAIHIKPETNSFDIYINGICQTSDIPTRLLSASNQTATTYNLVEQITENPDGSTVTKVVDTVTGRVVTNGTAGIVSNGAEDYPFGYARILPYTLRSYHGEDCLRENDACTNLHHTEECSDDCTTQHEHLDTCVVFCTESHTHTSSCTVACTANVTETNAPFKFVGNQVDVDSMKAYYSDIYLECAEHEYSVGTHEHNEEALTVSSPVSCKNCGAEWNVTVPMDQTGNSLCDLCEIANAQETMPTFHTADELKNYIKTSVGKITLDDGSGSFYIKDPAVTTVENVVENGNTYYKIGPSANEIYKNVNASDMQSGSVAKYVNSQYKGKSFVIQLDVRLGSSFLAKGSSLELLKLLSYTKNDVTTDTDLEAINSTGMINLSGTGMVTMRNGAGGTVNVGQLTTERFTTIAMHVKLADSANGHGSFDIYKDGKLVASDVQFLKSAELSSLNVNTKIGNYDVSINGIKDYCPTIARFFHTSLTVGEDFLHADNFLIYHADKYVDDYTQHDMVSEHKHDYSNNCTTYGSYCEHCGLGNGGYAVLDANSDKICDLCIAQKADFKANGILEATEITALGLVLAAQNNGSSKGTNSFNGTNATASVIKDGNVTTEGVGFQSIITEGGRTYIQIHGYKGTPECGKSSETYIQTGSGNVGSFNGLKARLADGTLDSYKGKSFVISLDLRLDKDYNYTTDIVDFRSYHAIRPSDGKMDPMNCSPLTVDKDGFLYAGGTKLSAKVNKSTADTVADFTNIAIHAFPKENKYSVYVDGVWQIEKTLFTEDQIKNYLTFDLQTDPETGKVINVLTGKECSNGISGLKSNGAEDYIFSWGRHFIIYGKAYHSGSCCDKAATTSSRIYAMTGEQASLDNLKTYYSDEYVECASHSYSLKGHTHDTETDELVATFECVCGKCSEIRLPIDTTGDNKCDSCGNYVLSGGALVTGRQVILDDLISLKLYANIGDALAADPTAKAIMTADDKTVEFVLSEMTKDKEGRYVFEIKLNSIQLTSTVSFVIEVGGETGNAYTTDIRDYAMSVIASTDDEYTKELCRSMLNYGAAAQEYFAWKSGDESIKTDLANALLSDSEKDISRVDSETLAAHLMSMSGTAIGVSFNSATLVLDSTISMKVYFTAPEDASVSINGKTVTPAMEGGEYFVRISGLLPHQLDTVHTISVTADGKTLSAHLSVLSTVHALLCSEKENEGFKNLGRALYLYSFAADMYQASAAEATVVVKDGAKGAAALVLDDGGAQAADYAQEYLQKYDKVAATFALNTHHLATLTKDADGYVFDENGKYTFTQTAEQENKEAYWNALLASADENGDVLRARIELISHSHTHALPKDGDSYAELLAPRHILQALFGYNTEALITPGGFTKTDEYDRVKDEVYIAGRGTNASENVTVMLNMLSEFAKDKRKRMDSFMIQYNKLWLNDAGTFSDATISAADAIKGNLAEGQVDVSHVEDFIDAAMANNALAAFCIHGIVPSTYNNGENTSGLHIYDEQADAIFAYVQQHAETGELWAATYSEAIKYFSQWNTSDIDVRDVSASVKVINLTDKEDDEIFDMRLTVKVSVSDAWTGATLTQGDYTETVEVKGEAGAKYVLVNVLPDGGIATLSAN